MTEWQPIDTAPKDGASILVYLEKPFFGSEVQTMRTGKILIIGSSFAFDAPAPTHWMPLPAPPPNPHESSQTHVDNTSPTPATLEPGGEQG